jgi:endonuclease-3 related protein
LTAREQLLDIYRRTLDRYGPQRWWPGDTRFEVMVGAVLTQAAAWTNVEKAIVNLKAADVLSPTGIRSLDEPELARLVYPSGYYNSKARKLKALVDYLGRRFGDDLDAMEQEDMASLRSELLDVYGIGEETADDILLFGLRMPSFIVDNYTRRIFSRLGILEEKASYTVYQALFTENLPEDRELFSEYHGLIVRHAKVTCGKRPLCHDCCLLDICPTGLSNVRTE